MTATRLERDALQAALLERLPEFVRGYVPADTPVRELGGEIRADRKGSLAVRLDSGLWFDHETRKGGDVFELARMLTGARDFPDILHRVADFTGTGTAAPIATASARPCPRARHRADTRAAARRVWHATHPIAGTVAAAYLDARGVGHVAGAAALRFHRGLSHPTAPGGRFPALVAGVQDASGRFLGIQRTYLDGPRKADLDPMRASLGRIVGGAVRLLEPADGALLVGEGIESTAAAVGVLDWRGGAWATLGTSGMAAVELPESVRRVVIAADRDAGGLRAAAALPERLEAEGRRVTIEAPPCGDFADWQGERA